MRLQKSLGKKYDVLTPRMPNSSNAKYADWKIFFERCIPHLDQEVIFIGHSLGGIFLAKYLSEERYPKKITAAFFVAAPYNTKEIHPLADFVLGDNLEKISAQCDNLFFYHSQDDEVVPFSSYKQYKEKLPAIKGRIFSDRGHMNGKKFPELVADITALTRSLKENQKKEAFEKRTKIILATTNPSKIEQIRDVFKNTRFRILTAAEAGVQGEAIEDGETLQENALKKALYAKERLPEGTWILADDTGVFIHALVGQPGIRATRWAGENATTDEIMQFTLKKLEGAHNRDAHFETVVALIAPDGRHRFFSGVAQGHFLEAPRTRPQPKMPYSPIFMPNQSNHVWAEMTVEEENRISHRGKAFSKAKLYMQEYYLMDYD